MASQRPDESPLGSVLARDERAHLVVLIGSITASIRDTAAKAVNNPSQSRSIRWLERWQEAVLKRVSEAANTRWEPLKTSKPKDWDELSWDEPSAKEGREEGDTSLHHLYPPVQTPLSELEKERRVLVAHSVLLILLSLKHYYAPSRILLVQLASSLNLGPSTLDEDEAQTAGTLMDTAKALDAQEEVDKKAKENQSARRWKVGLASVAGAAVIGLTGGLAAPLVAAGLGTVLGGLGLGATAAAGLLGSLAGSSVLVGGLFGAYGARMTSGMVDQYAREVSDFKFIPLRTKGERRLRVTIAISGWLNEKQEVLTPWKVLGTGTEVFALRWELETLMNLGVGLSEMVTSAAWNYAKLEILRRTVFASLLGAVMLPVGLLKLGSMVDNPFRVAKSRSDKAGEVLADALINRAQGERPVALLGYSLGARVIQSCLMSLQKRKAYGLIDSVILIGAPIPSDPVMWQAMRTMVAGRLVNVYSENDYVLGFLYRANSAQVGIAGLSKIEAVGIENKDVGDMVDGHLKYKALIGRILSEVGWEDLNYQEIEREHESLRIIEEQEKENLRKAEAKKASGAKGNDDLVASMEAKETVQAPSSNPCSPPPLPDRPANQSSQMHTQMALMNLGSNHQADTRPVVRKQVSRPNASKPQEQTQEPLIDLLGDSNDSAPQSFGFDPLSSYRAPMPSSSPANNPASIQPPRPSQSTSSSSSQQTRPVQDPSSSWSSPSFQAPAQQQSPFASQDKRQPSSAPKPSVEQAPSPFDRPDTPPAAPEAKVASKNQLITHEPTSSQLVEADSSPTHKHTENARDGSEDSDDEPGFQGIQMVDNDPNLL